MRSFHPDSVTRFDDVPHLPGNAEPDVNQADSVWSALAQKVDAFIAAWKGDQPPPLADFLPAAPAVLRRLTLVELIKVDLEHRAQRRCLRSLTEYFAEFPELCAGDAVPMDLLYEDFHIRQQAGETVVVADYVDRFPQHADRLMRLLGLKSTYHSTQLIRQQAPLVECRVGTQIDDFELLSELGSGAFAKVFLARQRSMQRLVALKVSHQASDEPQALAQLDHPHIVRVYDQRVLPGNNLRLLYMQYVAGGTLEAVIDFAAQTPPNQRTGALILQAVDRALYKRGETPPADSMTRRLLASLSWAEAVCWLGARLAEALQYAHAHGVLHRDIKPANVLLSAEGIPKLADFNISFSAGVEGSCPRAFFGGSLAYMSPEQLEAYDPQHSRQPDELDGRADMYSLGIMLWELYAGQRPFQDGLLPQGLEATIVDMTRRRKQGVPPDARAAFPAQAPPGMGDVLLTCLAPDPEDRFPHASELARQLDLCLLPHVQDLLRPSPTNWRQHVVRRPVLALLVACLLPNFALSVVNILFNREHSIVSADLWSLQLAVVNSLAYGSGIGISVWCLLPILAVASRFRRQQPLSNELRAAAAARCLAIGWQLSFVSLALWVLSGIVFPVWTHVATQAASPKTYVLYFGSMILCGLIGAGLTFFCATFLATRCIYPRLLAATSHEGALDELARVSSQVTGFLVILVITPLAAILALTITLPQFTQMYVTLAVVGAASFCLAFGLGRLIQRDVEALRIAASPDIVSLAVSGGAFLRASSRSLLESSRFGR